MNCLLNSKASLVLLATCFFSCAIEDNRGSIISTPGESIGSYGVVSNVIVNEYRQEIYFIATDRSYESLSLLAINYETKEVSELHKANYSQYDIRPIRNQRAEHRLLFITRNYSSNPDSSVLYEIDLETLNTREVLTLSSDGFEPSTNQDFVFFNSWDGISSNNIIKSDFDGNLELLTISGEVVFAIPETNLIIIQNYGDAGQQYQIYDYVLDSILLTKDNVYYYPDRFYTNDDEIFTSDYGHLVNFKTDEVLYSVGNAEEMFLDFNPVSNKVVFITYDGSDLYTPGLIIRDLTGDRPDTTILHGHNVGFAKILNDGKTVIYNNGQAFYKISTE